MDLDRASRYDAEGIVRERRPRPQPVAEVGRPWSREPARRPLPNVARLVGTDDPVHRWHRDTCRRCRLSRQEEWLLDEQRRAVVTLVWRMPGGRTVRVRPFPWFKDMAPDVPPSQTVADRYPGVEVGGEPPCPGSPEAWITLGVRAMQPRPSLADVPGDPLDEGPEGPPVLAHEVEELGRLDDGTEPEPVAGDE